MNLYKSFLMTLGHNSSVIFYDCENKPIGYEEERLSGIKSDSSYPIKSFEKILSIIDENIIYGSNIFISHWFDTFDFNNFPEKYFNQQHFLSIVHKYALKVQFVDNDFTHHDAHAYSGLAFKESQNPYIHKNYFSHHHLVIDGFGNNEEVISIYEEIKVDSQTHLKLIRRIYGYDNSLGLLYQYATSFCGMKENQDEYKFLGYESKINTVVSKEIKTILDYHIDEYVEDYFCDVIANGEKEIQKFEHTNKHLNLYKLGLVKDKTHQYLKRIIENIGFNQDDCRVIIGYFVQSIIENIVKHLLNYYHIKNVTCTGGCFMNVKLNNMILNHIDGYVCINPLAGDQGAAIGLFKFMTNERFNFGDLCWGVRDKSLFKNTIVNSNIVYNNTLLANTITCDEKTFIKVVRNLLEDNCIVNVVQNNMEFGPRALCNTSTLALPTKENVDYINAINLRNEVMPMAPVILDHNAATFMNGNKLDKCIGSDKFMIMAHDVDVRFLKGNEGVTHIKPNLLGYTCRPQIVDYNSTIGKILYKMKHMCIINTSFNTHGRPIVYSITDAIEDFIRQRGLDKDNRVYLVVLNSYNL